MNNRKTTFAIVLAAMIAGPAFAQSTATPVDRNVNQQKRIEQGLQSGQLNTREAGQLEHQETHVEKLESKAAADGTVSAREQQRINQAQDKVSKDIYAQKHDAQTGNPESASSQRLQKDVQRDVNQQTRIDNGVKSGSLTTREAGSLERGQARDTRKQARAAADGHVGAHEQNRIARSENHQSDRIYDKKHNGRHRS